MSREIKIRVEEKVSYSRKMLVDDSTLENFLVTAVTSDPYTINPTDFNLDYSDIDDGELDLDTLEIHEKVDGNWRQLFPA